MKRTDFIQQLVIFLESFPDGCSNYHVCDMLMRYIERHLMNVEWEEEEEEL